MKEKLPCVFRINVANPFWNEFRDLLTKPEFMNKILFKGENSVNSDYLNNIKITPMHLTNLEQYKNLVYNINIPRFELKKTEDLTKFHRFIQDSVESGLISRQEAVSMIPPMLLGVVPKDKVFDMCAAPGSKTAQFLENFYKGYDFMNPESIENDTGFVLANDNNYNRAYMMTHQLKRLNTAGMAVISHDAQFFPYLFKLEKNTEKVLFDKILADVPCSSDAVLRKLPHKWKNWGPKESFALHKLQLQILRRGLQLLKPGGTIIYSTCSLNPIENEAVVSEVMRENNGTLEIQDMSWAFKDSDIKIRQGLTTWKILAEEVNNKSNLIELNKNDELYGKFYKSYIEESCFPSEENVNRNIFQLHNCIRLFPHDSDTSGFFITVIKKLETSQPEKEKAGRFKNTNPDKGITFINDIPDIVNYLKVYYGLSDLFPFHQLVTNSKISKKINFISKGVHDLLKDDSKNLLKLINVGVKLFAANKKYVKSTEPIEITEEEQGRYRICQDGLFNIIPFMGKRIYFTTNEFLIQLLKETDIRHDDIQNEQLREKLHSLKSGCVIIVSLKETDSNFEELLKDPLTEANHPKYSNYIRNNFIDAICCFNSAVRLSTMISAEHQHVFNLKYNIKCGEDAKSVNPQIHKKK